MKWIYADKLILRFEKYATDCTDLHRLKKSLKSFNLWQKKSKLIAQIF